MRNISKRFIWFPAVAFVLGLLPQVVSGQNVSVKATLDSTVIVIGGQVGLTLEASMPVGLPLNFPSLADTVTSNVEVVNLAAADSTVANGLLTVYQRYIVTSFDSGLHYIPPFKFEIFGEAGTQTFETGSLALNVVNPFENVDPSKGITDIKPPFNLPFSLAELLKFLPYIAGFMLLAGLITIAVLKYLQRKGKIKVVVPSKPRDPAHIIAIRELEHIKSQQLWQRNLVKEYYVGISDTLRRYIEDRYGVDALEFTTDQTLAALKEKGFADSRNYEQLKEILNTSDLVKFARFEPLPDENDLMMIHAQFFVNQTKLEEIKSLEEQKQELLNSQEVQSN